MNKITNLKDKLIVTGFILLYVLISNIWGGVCIFSKLTGIPCPGCGMSRAVVALLQFRFAEAFGYHLMVWSLPFLYLCYLTDGKLFKKKAWNILFYVLIGVGFLVNWVRNLLFL